MIVFFYRLGSVPAPVWDEGWTWNVARNFVDFGHYGQIQAGQPASPGLAASYLVVAPVVASFRLLGVGVWQGRLPFVLFTWVCLGLIFYLSVVLHHRKISGWGALGVVIFMSGSEQWNIILAGRQTLGEIPAVVYLLSGFILMLWAWERHWAWMFPAGLLFAFAVETKAQVLPFLLVSLAVPLCIALLKGWWREAMSTVAVGIVMWWMGRPLLSVAYNWLVAGRTVQSPPLEGIYQNIALVTDLDIRLLALRVTITIGLATLLGLAYAAWNLRNTLSVAHHERGKTLMKIALLALAGSWYAWYLLLGMYWPRYLFPVFLIASPFTAALLYDLTSGYQWRASVRNSFFALRNKQFSTEALRNSLGLLLVMITGPLTLIVTGLSYGYLADKSLVPTAEYINHSTPLDALIESYDAPLYFLLNRPVHYPPDDLHLILNARQYRKEELDINYDPLTAAPDYLVIGPTGRTYGLYEAVLNSGNFILVQQYPGYEIYRCLCP